MRFPPGRWVFLCVPCELPPEASWRVTATSGRQQPGNQPPPGPDWQLQSARPAQCPRTVTSSRALE